MWLYFWTHHRLEHRIKTPEADSKLAISPRARKRYTGCLRRKVINSATWLWTQCSILLTGQARCNNLVQACHECYRGSGPLPALRPAPQEETDIWYCKPNQKMVLLHQLPTKVSQRHARRPMIGTCPHLRRPQVTLGYVELTGEGS